MKRKADGEPTKRRLQLPAGTSTASGTGTASAVWQASDGHYYCRDHDGRGYWVPPPHPSSACHPYLPHSHAWEASAAWNAACPPSMTSTPLYDAANISKFQRWEKRFRAALLAIGDTEFVLLPRAMAMAHHEAHDMTLRGPLFDDIIRRCKRDAEHAGMTFAPPPPPPPSATDGAVAEELLVPSAASTPNSTSTGDRVHVGPNGNSDAVEAGAASDADADRRRPDKITWEQGGSGVPTEKVLRERYPPPVYIAPPRSFQESYEQKHYRIRLMIDAHYYDAGGGGQSRDKKQETSSEVGETIDTEAKMADAEYEAEAKHNIGSSNNKSDIDQDICTLSAQHDQDDDCNVAVFDDDDDDDDDGGDDDKGTSEEEKKKEEDSSGDTNASRIPGTDNGSEGEGAMGQRSDEKELASASPSQYKAPPITYNLGLSWPDYFYCDPPWWSNKDKND